MWECSPCTVWNASDEQQCRRCKGGKYEIHKHGPYKWRSQKEQSETAEANMRILMTRMQMQKQQDEMYCAADQQLKKDKKIALQLSLAHTPDNDDMSASDKNALQMQEQRMQKEAGSARRKEKKDLQKAFNLSKKENPMQGRNGDGSLPC